MKLVTGCYFFAAVTVYKYTLSECILCNDEGKQGDCREKFYTTHTIAVDICICQHSLASSLILNLILLLGK